MYLPFGSACTERNSSTPMNPAAITAQDARCARVGNHFSKGNSALDTLIVTLGGAGIGPGVPGTNYRGAAADFRNAPSCDSPILGNGSLYGGRVATPGAGASPGFGGGGVPVSLGGAVVAASAVPVAASAPSAPTSLLSLLTSPAAARGPAAAASSAPGPWSWSHSGYGPRRYDYNERACASPEILPLMTVFPIPARGVLVSEATGSGDHGVNWWGLLVVGAGAAALGWAFSQFGKG